MLPPHADIFRPPFLMRRLLDAAARHSDAACRRLPTYAGCFDISAAYAIDYFADDAL